MKKLLIVVAVLLTAGIFTSCNTEMCYEITSKVTVLGISSTATEYVVTTKNNIREAEQEIKDALKETGIAEDAIEITSRPAADSNCK